MKGGVVVTPKYVGRIKGEMRTDGFELPSFRGKRPGDLKLTPVQEKMLKEVMPDCRKAISYTAKMHKFRPETREEFHSFVMRYLPGWVKRHDTKRGAKLSTYITENVNWSVRTFIRDQIKLATGLPYAQVEKMSRLIKGINGNKSLKQAAIEAGVPLSEATELVNAYYSAIYPLGYDSVVYPQKFRR